MGAIRGCPSPRAMAVQVGIRKACAPFFASTRRSILWMPWWPADWFFACLAAVAAGPSLSERPRAVCFARALPWPSSARRRPRLARARRGSDSWQGPSGLCLAKRPRLLAAWRRQTLQGSRPFVARPGSAPQTRWQLPPMQQLGPDRWAAPCACGKRAGATSAHAPWQHWWHCCART